MNLKIINSTIDDNEILERVKSGEIALYEIIIRRYNPLLYKIGRSYGLQHEDVQDAIQETYISAFENLGQFQQRSLLSTWLTKIMINKCLYTMKRRVDKIPLNTAGELNKIIDDIQAAGSGQFPLQTELKRIMELSLEKLPEPYRLVFLLRETENFSVAQTAETLNISETNVKVRLNRAKSMLREYLEKWYTKTDIYDFNLKYCDAVVKAVFEKIKD